MTKFIRVFYYTGPHTSTLLPAAEALVARLSTVRRRRFDRCIGTQRVLDLAAVRVLELGMQACGHKTFALADIEYPCEAGVSGKPRWTAGVASFNISHATSIAACVIADNCTVGLDVENHRVIDPQTVRRLLTDDASIARGLDAGNALARWTQVESILKGAGLGVMHGREIVWRDDAIMLRGQQWRVHQIDCGPEHVAHVAVDVPSAIVNVQRIAEL